MKTRVRQAEIEDVDALVPLFDAYRQFYRQPPDLARARAFLAERFAHQESLVLLAEQDGEAIGFTQLYPLFSSVRTVRTWLLNDLFVAPAARRSGAATSASSTDQQIRKLVGRCQRSTRFMAFT